MHVLIVDDDPIALELLRDTLAHAGHDLACASNGAEAFEHLKREEFNVLITDWQMPGMDGIELCQAARRAGTGGYLYVILLTGHGSVAERIRGLSAGADDFMTKPFEPRELLARIRSVLRRVESLPPNLQPAPVRFMRFAGWTLDLDARQLLDPEGVVVVLSAAEFRLLKVFLEHPNRVLNRDQLLNLTRGRDADPFDRSMDLQVSRLRQKLREDARAPQLIKTVRNEGYVLATAVTTEQHL